MGNTMVECQYYYSVDAMVCLFAKTCFYNTTGVTSFFQWLKFLSIKNQFDDLIVPHVGRWHFLFYASGCLFRVLLAFILSDILFHRCSWLGNLGI